MNKPNNQAFGLKFTLTSGAAYVFTKLPISIGRGSTNDLVLDDQSVSASHALVYFDDRVGAVCIADRDSLNGIYIGELPTCRNVLMDGARIRIGGIELIFQDTGYIHSK